MSNADPKDVTTQQDCAHEFIEGADCPKCGMTEHAFEMEFYGDQEPSSELGALK